MQIGILLIAGAVEINFVSYDAKMLGKYGSRKPRLCAPFYRACPERPRKRISQILILIFYYKRWPEDPICTFAN